MIETFFVSVSSILPNLEWDSPILVVVALYYFCLCAFGLISLFISELHWVTVFNCNVSFHIFFITMPPFTFGKYTLPVVLCILHF